jgi:hypothetical protein
MKAKPRVFTIFALLSGLAAAALLTARAATPEQPGEMYCRFSVSEANRVLQGRPVMVSAIRDGQVVEQQETQFNGDRSLSTLQPGLYDARAEGDGMVTEVKRGVHVFPGRRIDLFFEMRPGKGAHVVEYATGGLSREEVAARLAKLEAAVTQLQKSIPPK